MSTGIRGGCRPSPATPAPGRDGPPAGIAGRRGGRSAKIDTHTRGDTNIEYRRAHMYTDCLCMWDVGVYTN